ncbi:MAG: septal ring lytic transglycosylase RlpA family protein [Elainellaceae cyanobacterium]
MKVLGALWIASQLGNSLSVPNLPTVHPGSETSAMGLVLSTVVSQPTQPETTLPPGETRLTSQNRANQDATKVLQLSTSLTRWSEELRSVIKPALLRISVVRAGSDSQEMLSSQAVEPQDNAPSFHQAFSNQALKSCSQSALQTLTQNWKENSPVFQVRIEDALVVEVPTQQLANSIAQQIQQVFNQPNFDPSTLYPAVINGHPGAKSGQETIMEIADSDLSMLDMPSDLIAIAWVNNLRMALGEAPLPVPEAQAAAYGLKETEQEFEGTASWYGPYFHGRLTASGEEFDQDELTAAHPSLPFDTYLKVTNLENNRTLIVRVNDRGPYIGRRSLDLSWRSALCLGSEVSGVVPYRAVIMKPAPPGKSLEDSDTTPAMVSSTTTNRAADTKLAVR